MSDSSALRIAAQSYADLGLSVIPVKPRSKMPELSRWQQYQGRRATDKELDDWFSRPKNIAIVCGEVSGGLVVLDFDDPNAFAYCFPKHHELVRQTLVVETDRGVHVYVRLKGGGKPKSTTYRRKGKERAWLPVDVQAEGKYAIGPPSVHPSGKSYRFLGDASSILELQSESVLHADLALRAQEWPFIERVLPHWNEGTRHNLALGLAKILRYRCGFDDARTEDVVRRLCGAAGDISVEDRIRAVRDTIAKGPEETAAMEWLGRELYDSLVILVPKRRQRIRPKGDEGPAPHAEYVKRLMDEHVFATTEDTDEIFVYTIGVYRPGEALIRSWGERQFIDEDDSAKRELVNEIVDAVRRRSYMKRETFNPDGKLCLRNGVLDLGTLALSPHSSNDRFTVQLPVEYDSAAKCPEFDRFLAEILPDPEVRKVVQMTAGYCFEDGYRLQRATMFVGPGNNGKSTLLGVLKDLLGLENVSSETLQSLSENRFASANLWGKLANICADLPSNPVRYTGIFKMATGGDPMRGEWKHRAAFTFVNRAKLVFSCNELPEVSDRTKAFWRRWNVVRFSIDLTGREDRSLPDKLRAEISGILTWTLEGLRMLRDAGDFPRSAGTDAIMQEWKQRADSLYWFVSERVVEDPKGWVSKDDLYEAYVSFAEGHGLRVKKREVVGEELPNLFPSVRSERQRIVRGSPQVRGWSGVRFSEAYVSENDMEVPASPAYPVSATGQTTLSETGETGETGKTIFAPENEPALTSLGYTSQLEAFRAIREAASRIPAEADAAIAEWYDRAMRSRSRTAPEPPTYMAQRCIKDLEDLGLVLEHEPLVLATFAGLSEKYRRGPEDG